MRMPKISKYNLILFTGIIWLTASLILVRRAYSWIDLLSTLELVIGLALAFPFAILKIYFIFRKLTLKNINRILSFKQLKVSIWEFHIKKDKLLIVFMILLGTLLRKTPFLPKYYLFPVYVGISMAMFYAWVLYLKTFFKNLKWSRETTKKNRAISEKPNE